MDNQRIRYLTIILGTNGTGKTTFLRKLTDSFKKNDVRTLMVTPDDIEWGQYTDYSLVSKKDFNFKGFRKHIFEPKHTFKAISENYRRGALILDDCRDYIPANLEYENDFRNLLIRRRHKEIDVFLVAHGFTDIPKKIFTYVNRYILFKTTDSIDDRKREIRDFEKVKEAIFRVNSKNAKTIEVYKKGRISYYEFIQV